MVKRGLMILFLVMFCISLVSAMDTEIEIKTLPNHEVHLTILDPIEDYYALQGFKNTSDEYGDASFVYTSEKVTQFDLRIIVKEGDKRIYDEEFREVYDAGELITLVCAPEDAELIETPVDGTETNESLNETEEVLVEETNETEESEGIFSIAGNAIYEKGKQLFSNNITYYVIAVIVLATLVLIARRRGYLNFRSSSGNSSDVKVDKKEDELAAAERRLREAKEEVERLKNGGDEKNKKMNELKKRMIEIQKELMRLRGDDN